MANVDAALARIDALLHQLTAEMAPGLDLDGEVEDLADPPNTMALNSWGVVCLYTDVETGHHYLRVFSPPSLPPPFLRGLLYDAADMGC